MSFLVAFVTSLADTITILEKVKKLVGLRQPKSPIYDVADRVFQVFSAHGVNRANINRFIDPKHGVTLADLYTHQSFIKKISDQLLDEVAEIFSINREWLTCHDESIYPRYHCYGNLKVIIDHFHRIQRGGVDFFGGGSEELIVLSVDKFSDYFIVNF